MNMKQRLSLRAALKNAVREFFGTRDYLEVDTPVLVPCPGTEVYLRYFGTNWIDEKNQQHLRWLRSSPELHMKQILAHGVPRIFQIAPCFRNNGELSEWHNPEFTMLEWYETGISFGDFIHQTESLLRETLAKLKSLSPVALSMPKKVEKFTLAQAFSEFANIELLDLDPELALRAKKAGVISVNYHDDFETAFFKVLIERIEPALSRLGVSVLYDYPPSQAALARVENSVAKRFEFYVNRIEICNGFYELLDADENQRRIQENNSKRKTLGFEVTDEDPGFYAALKQGLPASCGNALGLDRWLALCLGVNTIEEIQAFKQFP